MRLTIICDDNLVVKDGEARMVDCSAWPAVHAVQWYGNHGEVEYKAAGDAAAYNEKIDDITPFNDLIAAWMSWTPPVPAINPAAIVEQSYQAGLRRQADQLAAAGKTYDAVKLLMKANGMRNA